MEKFLEPIPFGKYELLERLAVGGMAEVFRARVRAEGGFEKHLVIKRILPHLSSDSEFVVMLIDEAKIAVCLSHPNIVQVYDLGKIEGTYFIAMEFIEGGDLREILRRCTERNITVPIHHAIYITTEVLKGLDYAHSKRAGTKETSTPLQIIHRDISPPNILLSYAGEVKIVDFGIAKASTRMMETAAGILKGKFEYMSPEQASGLSVDARTDLFSTAVLLYEMLVGKNPFSAEADLQVLNNVRNARVVPPSRLNPSIPPRLEQIVMKALQLDVNKRYVRAGEMGADLLSFAYQSGDVSNASKLSRFMADLFTEDIAAGRTASSAAPRSPKPNLSRTDLTKSEFVKTTPAQDVRPPSSRVPHHTFEDDLDDEGVTEAINLADFMRKGGAGNTGTKGRALHSLQGRPEESSRSPHNSIRKLQGNSLSSVMPAISGKEAISFFDSPGASPEFDATFVPPPVEDDDEVATTVQLIPAAGSQSQRRTPSALPRNIASVPPVQQEDFGSGRLTEPESTTVQSKIEDARTRRESISARPATAPEIRLDSRQPEKRALGPTSEKQGARPDDGFARGGVEARPTMPLHASTREKPPRTVRSDTTGQGVASGIPAQDTKPPPADAVGTAERQVLPVGAAKPPRLPPVVEKSPPTAYQGLEKERADAVAVSHPGGVPEAVDKKGTVEHMVGSAKRHPVFYAFLAGLISGIVLTATVVALFSGNGKSVGGPPPRDFSPNTVQHHP